MNVDVPELFAGGGRCGSVHIVASGRPHRIACREATEGFHPLGRPNASK